MKFVAATGVCMLLLVGGCRPSEDDLRRILREELSGMMTKELVAPAKTIGPYTPAVRIGGFLFLSGQIGIDHVTGTLVSASFEAEVEQVLRNVTTVLHAAGYDSSHVVSTTVFLKNMNDFEKMNSVYARFFPTGAYPARTTVGVSELPRGANVEVAVVAYKH